MALTEDCRDRVHNWKFLTAEKLLTEDATDYEEIVVKALADTFANSGWFNGSMGAVVQAAVEYVLGRTAHDEEGSGTDVGEPEPEGEGGEEQTAGTDGVLGD